MVSSAGLGSERPSPLPSAPSRSTPFVFRSFPRLASSPEHLSLLLPDKHGSRHVHRLRLVESEQKLQSGGVQHLQLLPVRGEVQAAASVQVRGRVSGVRSELGQVGAEREAGEIIVREASRGCGEDRSEVREESLATRATTPFDPRDALQVPRFPRIDLLSDRSASSQTGERPLEDASRCRGGEGSGQKGVDLLRDRWAPVARKGGERRQVGGRGRGRGRREGQKRERDAEGQGARRRCPGEVHAVPFETSETGAEGDRATQLPAKQVPVRSDRLSIAQLLQASEQSLHRSAQVQAIRQAAEVSGNATQIHRATAKVLGSG